MKRVLYAEDSVASQALMRRYLKDVCEVVVAPTPRAASAMLADEPYAALITDFMFHDCDASELIEQTRRKCAATELPIVVVSSSMDKVLATRLLALGANEVAAKPLHPGDFRTVMQRMLEQPYVCRQELRSTCLPAIQWQADGRFHEFCPEFGLELSADSAEEVSRAMLAALKAKLVAGSAPGHAHHARLVTHMLEY